jgi:N-acetylglucosamine-6-phosphate deacetylase
MQVVARHWQTGTPVAVRVEAGVVAECRPAADRPDLPWLAPSFFDLQVNGGLGVNFTDLGLTADGVAMVADACRRAGCGGFLPTAITAHPDVISRSARTLAAAGFDIHLEGPFLNPTDGYRGAHPVEHVRPPDADLFRRWQDAAGGRIRLVTVAPELPGAIPFIERLTAAGVAVALGHTAADAATVSAAVAAGAKLSTHLGNGLPAMAHRHLNPVWPQLAEPRLWASVIADGHHLPAEVLRCVARLKPDGLILVSDASPLAGLPPGRYPLWGTDCEVTADGRVGVAGTPYLAGAGAFLGTCVGRAVRLGLTVAEAVAAASVRPRELLGLPVPTLEVGRPADFVLFDLTDEGLTVRQLPG